MSRSTESPRRSKPPKPAKPHPSFPLFAHPSGQWARKIRGRLVYFGVWADPDAALARHDHEYKYLKEGKTPPPVTDGTVAADACTVSKLANRFLRAKEDKLDTGDLSPRSFRDYYRTSEGLVTFFGKERRLDDLQPLDFEQFRKALAKRLGVSSLGNEINRVKIVLKFAEPSPRGVGLIDKPVNIGPEFKRTSEKLRRRERNARGRSCSTGWKSVKSSKPPMWRCGRWSTSA